MIKISEKLNANNFEFELIRGVLYSYLKPDSKQKLHVKAQSASFGVRGTKFFLSYKAGKDPYLCVCDGAVEAKNATHSVIVKPGQDSHVNRSGNITVTEASDDMWGMAVEGFAEMNLTVNHKR